MCCGSYAFRRRSPRRCLQGANDSQTQPPQLRRDRRRRSSRRPRAEGPSFASSTIARRCASGPQRGNFIAPARRHGGLRHRRTGRQAQWNLSRRIWRADSSMRDSVCAPARRAPRAAPAASPRAVAARPMIRSSRSAASSPPRPRPLPPQTELSGIVTSVMSPSRCEPVEAAAAAGIGRRRRGSQPTGSSSVPGRPDGITCALRRNDASNGLRCSGAAGYTDLAVGKCGPPVSLRPPPGSVDYARRSSARARRPEAAMYARWAADELAVLAECSDRARPALGGDVRHRMQRDVNPDSTISLPTMSPKLRTTLRRASLQARSAWPLGEQPEALRLAGFSSNGGAIHEIVTESSACLGDALQPVCHSAVRRAGAT